MPKYAQHTYNSPNPLARFAHRARLKYSLSSLPLKQGAWVLDFGCGDAKLLNSLRDQRPGLGLTLIGYEPFMESVSNNQIRIYKSLDNIKALGKFDIISCFEVLEHFNAKNQLDFLNKMASLLREGGVIVVSVPIETGFPSVVKNIRRALLHRLKLYSTKNILKAAFSISVPECREGNGYLSHMGFNHRDFEQLLRKRFTITNKSFSPFKALGGQFNSQVFYHLALPSYTSNPLRTEGCN